MEIIHGSSIELQTSSALSSLFYHGSSTVWQSLLALSKVESGLFFFMLKCAVNTCPKTSPSPGSLSSTHH